MDKELITHYQTCFLGSSSGRIVLKDLLYRLKVFAPDTKADNAEADRALRNHGGFLLATLSSGKSESIDLFIDGLAKLRAYTQEGDNGKK